MLVHHLTGRGLPKVKIEAKLDAALGAGQLRSYASDIHQRSPQGVLLVLVPHYRREEAMAVASQA